MGVICLKTPSTENCSQVGDFNTMIRVKQSSSEIMARIEHDDFGILELDREDINKRLYLDSSSIAYFY